MENKKHSASKLVAVLVAVAVLCSLVGGILLGSCGTREVENGKSAYELAVANGYTGDRKSVV